MPHKVGSSAYRLCSSNCVPQGPVVNSMPSEKPVMLFALVGPCVLTMACGTTLARSSQLREPATPAPVVDTLDSGTALDATEASPQERADVAEDNGCGPASNWWFNSGGVLHPRRLLLGDSAEAREACRCLSLTSPR